MNEFPVVLITAASGGIAGAVAHAGRGARLVLAARSAGLLDDLVKACERRDRGGGPTPHDHPGLTLTQRHS